MAGALPAGRTIRTVAEFEGWLADAAKGERFCYVNGPAIPSGCAVARAVMQAYYAGLVSPVQDRIGGERAYLAERTGKSLPDSIRPRLSLSAQVQQIERRRRAQADADAVLDLLEDAAFARRACPTVAQIVRMTGLSEYAVRAALAHLRSADLIADEIVSSGAHLVRVVAVRSVACRTAAPRALPLSAERMAA